MRETQVRTHVRLLCCSCLSLQLPSSVAVHAQELQGSAMYLIHRLAFFHRRYKAYSFFYLLRH